MLKNILFVGLGGFLGSSSRYVISKYLNSHFPYGTLLVNVVGSFLLGWLVFRLARENILAPEMALLLTTGFIGAFTTFSTFMVETHLLFEQQTFLIGFLNLAGSLVLGLSAAYLGMLLGK